MTDRRDTDEELATLLSELEGTLTELRGELGGGDVGSGDQSGRERGRSGRSRPFQPPRFREILRFTEQQTIPTLIAILEANIRLLRLAGATLRAVDPERSAVETDGQSAASRAIDAGGRISADSLTSGLSELQEALAGTDAPNPEARRLLDDAETLSAEVREQLGERTGRNDAPTDRDSSGGGVSIEVEDASGSDDSPESDGSPEADGSIESDDAEPDSGVDVDAELDSIRDEVRGDGTDGEAESDDGDPAAEEREADEEDEDDGGA